MYAPTPDPAVVAAKANTERFYTQLISVHDFNKIEVRPVIDGLLSPTEEECCYIATFIRVNANVESLIRLDSMKDFQAIAMIARSLFELAVDLKLAEDTPNSWMKIKFHAEVEKLRLAQNVVAFKKANPDIDTDTAIYESFITKNAVRIESNKKVLWKGLSYPQHWSGMTLRERCTDIKAPFNQMYVEDYARLSWFIHSGVTGVFSVPASTFVHICAYAYHLASKCYVESLSTMIRKFQLVKGNELVVDRLSVAFQCAFANADEELEALGTRAGITSDYPSSVD
jgi:hypothetical protein